MVHYSQPVQKAADILLSGRTVPPEISEGAQQELSNLSPEALAELNKIPPTSSDVGDVISAAVRAAQTEPDPAKRPEILNHIENAALIILRDREHPSFSAYENAIALSNLVDRNSSDPGHTFTDRDIHEIAARASETALDNVIRDVWGHVTYDGLHPDTHSDQTHQNFVHAFEGISGPAMLVFSGKNEDWEFVGTGNYSKSYMAAVQRALATTSDPDEKKKIVLAARNAANALKADPKAPKEEYLAAEVMAHYPEQGFAGNEQAQQAARDKLLENSRAKASADFAHRSGDPQHPVAATVLDSGKKPASPTEGKEEPPPFDLPGPGALKPRRTKKFVTPEEVDPILERELRLMQPRRGDHRTMLLDDNLISAAATASTQVVAARIPHSNVYSGEFNDRIYFYEGQRSGQFVNIGDPRGYPKDQGKQIHDAFTSHRGNSDLAYEANKMKVGAYPANDLPSLSASTLPAPTAGHAFDLLFHGHFGAANAEWAAWQRTQKRNPGSDTGGGVG